MPDRTLEPSSSKPHPLLSSDAARPLTDPETDTDPIIIPTAARPKRARTRAWLIFPMGIAGIIVAIVLASVLAPQPPHTVSEVTRHVRDVVLRRSDRPGVEDGGPFGPWWIAAREADVTTGELTDFRLRAGQMRLAARRAQLLVDAEANTISFALEEVVVARIPESPGDAELDHYLIDLDSFILGPVPYQRRIIPDGHPAAVVDAPSRIAGVSTE